MIVRRGGVGNNWGWVIEHTKGEHTKEKNFLNLLHRGVIPLSL